MKLVKLGQQYQNGNMKAHEPTTAPAPTIRPEIAPAEPSTIPAPKTPFSPSIQPETTPKG
jgi:hypothetical protein